MKCSINFHSLKLPLLIMINFELNLIMLFTIPAWKTVGLLYESIKNHAGQGLITQNKPHIKAWKHDYNWSLIHF